MKVSIDSKTAERIEVFCMVRKSNCKGCPYNNLKCNQEPDPSGWNCIFINIPATWSWSESA